MYQHLPKHDVEDAVSEFTKWAGTEIFMATPVLVRVMETELESDAFTDLIAELKKIQSFVHAAE